MTKFTPCNSARECGSNLCSAALPSLMISLIPLRSAHFEIGQRPFVDIWTIDRQIMPMAQFQTLPRSIAVEAAISTIPENSPDRGDNSVWFHSSLRTVTFHHTSELSFLLQLQMLFALSTALPAAIRSNFHAWMEWRTGRSANHFCTIDFSMWFLVCRSTIDSLFWQFILKVKEAQAQHFRRGYAWSGETPLIGHANRTHSMRNASGISW
jgi:hypothetical protein